MNRSQVETSQTEWKQTASPIIVRIGGKALVPDNGVMESEVRSEHPVQVEPQVHPRVSETRGTTVAYTTPREVAKDKFEASSWHRWKDAFRTGITVGAFLGCLCMVLFHQVGLNRGTTTALAQSVNAVAAAVTSAMATAPDEGTDVVLSVPSITVHVLAQGPFQTLTDANKSAAVKWNGSAGVVTGSGPYAVWRAISLTGNGLLNVQNHSPKDGITATVVTLSPKQVPLTLLPQGPDRAEVTHWFSAEVSALRTLTGAVQGEMTVQDAVQSVANTDKSQPGNPESRSTGVLQTLQNLNQTLDVSAHALTQGQRATAESELLKAWSQLLSIEGDGLSK